MRRKCFGAVGDVLGPKHLVRNGSLIAVTAFVPAPVWELQENAGPKRESNLPQSGMVIKPFSVVDTGGIAFTEADLDGPVQVGSFSVGCGPCRTLTDALLADPPAARFVSVVDGDPSDPEATVRLVEKVSGLGRVAVVGTDDPVPAALALPAGRRSSSRSTPSSVLPPVVIQPPV